METNYVTYLADDCVAVSSIPGRRFLRSAAHLELTVPRTRTITSGSRAFLCVGQRSGTRCRANWDNQNFLITVLGRNLKLNCSWKAAIIIIIIIMNFYSPVSNIRCHSIGHKMRIARIKIWVDSPGRWQRAYREGTQFWRGVFWVWNGIYNGI